MIRILNRVTGSVDRFWPATPQEFLALQLARKLGDTNRIHDYLLLMQSHPTDLLLRAYRRTVKHRNGNIAEQFRSELNRLVQPEEQ